MNRRELLLGLVSLPVVGFAYKKNINRPFGVDRFNKSCTGIKRKSVEDKIRDLFPSNSSLMTLIRQGG